MIFPFASEFVREQLGKDRKLNNSFLFYGAKQTGKTLMLRAIANEC